MEEKQYHLPVLLQEVIQGLNIQPEGTYADVTFGGGGHSRAILERLKGGKLFTFDQDEAAGSNKIQDDRVTFIAQNFRHLQKFLRLYHVGKLDGLVADLGVSSYQFDTPERGFSTRFPGMLDMRMDQRMEVAASKIVKTYSEKQLHQIFEKWGEVTNAKTLAKTIVHHRKTFPMDTVDAFKLAIQPIVKGNPHRYLAQVFQALRIAVNDELGALKDLLVQSASCLHPGGRLVIITFHSLEDRMVKNFMRSGETDPDMAKLSQENRKKDFVLITKKPITAGPGEIQLNPRARSAKLRVAEKI
ncbi:MAG: 16S rRNA (cytosine(1402)-N(4))-methyltransferase RsmH [Chitinophagaceae bacterium]